MKTLAEVFEKEHNWKSVKFNLIFSMVITAIFFAYNLIWGEQTPPDAPVVILIIAAFFAYAIYVLLFTLGMYILGVTEGLLIMGYERLKKNKKQVNEQGLFKDGSGDTDK